MYRPRQHHQHHQQSFWFPALGRARAERDWDYDYDEWETEYDDDRHRPRLGRRAVSFDEGRSTVYVSSRAPRTYCLSMLTSTTLPVVSSTPDTTLLRLGRRRGQRRELRFLLSRGLQPNGTHLLPLPWSSTSTVLPIPPLQRNLHRQESRAKSTSRRCCRCGTFASASQSIFCSSVRPKFRPQAQLITACWATVLQGVSYSAGDVYQARANGHQGAGIAAVSRSGVPRQPRGRPTQRSSR